MSFEDENRKSYSRRAQGQIKNVLASCSETPEPDYRTLEEKLGPEFEERLSAVILASYNNAAMDLVKYAPYGCAEEEAERLRMCVAEMMGFRV